MVPQWRDQVRVVRGKTNYVERVVPPMPDRVKDVEFKTLLVGEELMVRCQTHF